MNIFRTIVYSAVLAASVLYIYDHVHIDCYNILGFKGCNTVVTKP